MLFQMIIQAKEWFKTMVVRDEKGQGLVEYALIILLVSIAVIIVLGLLGDQVTAVFDNITNVLGGAGQPGGE